MEDISGEHFVSIPFDSLIVGKILLFIWSHTQTRAVLRDSFSWAACPPNPTDGHGLHYSWVVALFLHPVPEEKQRKAVGSQCQWQGPIQRSFRQKCSSLPLTPAWYLCTYFIKNVPLWSQAKIIKLCVQTFIQTSFFWKFVAVCLLKDQSWLELSGYNEGTVVHTGWESLCRGGSPVVMSFCERKPSGVGCVSVPV